MCVEFMQNSVYGGCTSSVDWIHSVFRVFICSCTEA